MNENKQEGLKYILFIGIPVIIILGVLGAYYYTTSPITILSKTINELYHQIDKIETKEMDTNIYENPFQIKMNASFQTDLKELKEIQKYNYNIELGLDYSKEYMELLLGMKEKEKEIIEATFYQFQNKQYVKSEKLFDKMLEVNNNVPWNEMFDLEDLKQNENTMDVETTKEILKEIKNIFIKSLDKKYISREKKDITIDNSKIKTTKITYLLNKENQEYTKTYLTNQIKQDKKLMEKIAKITKKTEEDIKESLEEWKNNKIEEDYQIELYTEGINQNVIEIILRENKDEIINYINYKEINRITYKDELSLSFKEINENKINLDYEIKKENITGSLEITTNDGENLNNMDIYLKMNSKEFNGEIKLNIEISSKQLEIPDWEDAKNIEDLTSSEVQTLFENLEKSLQGTFFYDLLEKNMM